MKNKFEKLKYFSDNIKPKHELQRSQSDKIDVLVKSAFQCHLNPETINDPNKIDCELCQIKQSMKVYESIIFSKTLNSNVEKENIGTWKVSYFEWMLKCKFCDNLEFFHLFTVIFQGFTVLLNQLTKTTIFLKKEKFI